MEIVNSPCFKCECRLTGCHSVCKEYKLYQAELAIEKTYIHEQKETQLKSMNCRAEKWTKRWKKQR